MFPLFNLNGKIVTADQPHFYATNRSLKYGDGLFEGMRLMNGEILFFEDHISRLLEGMEALQLKTPDHFTSAYFYKLIYDLLIANKIEENVIIRIQVYRAGAGLYEPAKDEVEFFIELLQVPADSFAWYEKGISVGIFKEWKKDLNPAMNFKTSNSLVYVMASRWKREMKLDDALLINTSGNVCDGTSATVFLWKNKKLVTPPLAEGAIRGVMRKQVMEFTSTQSIAIEEKIVTENDILTADEIFLTNISRGVRWVEWIGEKKYGYELTRQVAIDFYKSLSLL